MVEVQPPNAAGFQAVARARGPAHPHRTNLPGTAPPHRRRPGRVDHLGPPSQPEGSLAKTPPLVSRRESVTLSPCHLVTLSPCHPVTPCSPLRHRPPQLANRSIVHKHLAIGFLHRGTRVTSPPRHTPWAALPGNPRQRPPEDKHEGSIGRNPAFFHPSSFILPKGVLFLCSQGYSHPLRTISARLRGMQRNARKPPACHGKPRIEFNVIPFPIQQSLSGELALAYVLGAIPFRFGVHRRLLQNSKMTPTNRPTPVPANAHGYLS